MKIVWSDHAEERAKERGIRKKDVFMALVKPDWYEPTYYGRIKIQKRIEGRTLEIIYIEEKEQMIIITCYEL